MSQDLAVGSLGVEGSWGFGFIARPRAKEYRGKIELSKSQALCVGSLREGGSRGQGAREL